MRIYNLASVIGMSLLTYINMSSIPSKIHNLTVPPGDLSSKIEIGFSFTTYRSDYISIIVKQNNDYYGSNFIYIVERKLHRTGVASSYVINLDNKKLIEGENTVSFDCYDSNNNKLTSKTIELLTFMPGKNVMVSQTNKAFEYPFTTYKTDENGSHEYFYKDKIVFEQAYNEYYMNGYRTLSFNHFYITNDTGIDLSDVSGYIEFADPNGYFVNFPRGSSDYIVKIPVVIYKYKYANFPYRYKLTFKEYHYVNPLTYVISKYQYGTYIKTKELYLPKFAYNEFNNIDVSIRLEGVGICKNNYTYNYKFISVYPFVGDNGFYDVKTEINDHINNVEDKEVITYD